MDQETEEREFGQSGALWDAGVGVCCAAFQLGACEHTEAIADADQFGQDDHGPGCDGPLNCTCSDQAPAMGCDEFDHPSTCPLCHKPLGSSDLFDDREWGTCHRRCVDSISTKGS